MAESGLLTEVRWEWDGTETIADLAPGATTVMVENATTLAEDGEVWIGDSGPYLITAVDEETDTITFTPPFDPEDGEVADEGEPVVPDAGGGPAQVWLAEVILVDADTPVEIPLTVHDLSVMPEGAYDPPKAVLVSDDYERIENLPGHVPVIDGGFIDPDTLPDPTAPTEPPVNSPALTVTGTTNGLVVRADEVEATTLIAYHIIKAPEGWDGDEPLDFTPSEDTLIGEPTRSTVLVVTELPDGTPLALGTTYYLRAVASNVVGEAPPGPQADGQLDPANISEIVAEQLVAGFVLAGSIRVGQITIDPDTGITIPQADGGNTHFPSDGSPATITGALRTNDMLVENNLTINGELNAIAGTLGLASVVKAPVSAPDVGWQFPHLGTVADGGRGVYLRGFADSLDGQRWLTLELASGQVRAYRKSDGERLANEVGRVSGYPQSVTRLGNHFYILTRTATRDQIVVKRTADTNEFVASSGEFLAGDDVDGLFTGIGTDGTDILVASAPAGGSDWTRLTTLTTDLTLTGSVRLNGHKIDSPSAVGRGPIGPSGEDYTWVTSDQGTMYVYNENRNHVGDYFGCPATGAFTTDDGRLCALDRKTGRVYRINTDNHWVTTPSVAFTWYDSDPGGTGTHETDLSPTVRYRPRPGSMLRVTTPPPPDNGNPDDPNTVRIYIDDHRQAEQDPADRTAHFEYLSTGAPPPTTNGFESATGNPGILRSDAADTDGPLIELRGNGSGRVGDLRWGPTGKPIPNTWVLVGTAGGPPFENGAQSAFDGWEPGFLRDGTGGVHMKGRVTPGSSGVVFTLPEGYRPEYALQYPMTNSGGDVGRLNIATDGTITVAAYANWINLACYFPAAP